MARYLEIAHDRCPDRDCEEAPARLVVKVFPRVVHQCGCFCQRERDPEPIAVRLGQLPRAQEEDTDISLEERPEELAAELAGSGSGRRLRARSTSARGTPISRIRRRKSFSSRGVLNVPSTSPAGPVADISKMPLSRGSILILNSSYMADAVATRGRTPQRTAEPESSRAGTAVSTPGRGTPLQGRHARDRSGHGWKHLL